MLNRTFQILLCNTATMGSKGTFQMPVQELAGALGTPDVPAQYIARAQEEQQLAAVVVAPVPVIDLVRLSKHGDGTSDEAAKLRSAIESWGLLMVSNNSTSTTLKQHQACISMSYLLAGQ